MRRYLLPIPAVVLLVCSAAFCDEGEWTRFRGPNGAGISDATTVPVRWGDEDYNWQVPLPGVGHSSPVVWGRRIFVTGGDPETAERVILCLDTADGHTLWRRDEPSKTHRQHRDNCYATATPAVDAGDEFEILARVPLGEPSYATPAVDSGVIYLRTFSHLFSLGGQMP